MKRQSDSWPELTGLVEACSFWIFYSFTEEWPTEALTSVQPFVNSEQEINCMNRALLFLFTYKILKICINSWYDAPYLNYTWSPTILNDHFNSSFTASKSFYFFYRPSELSPIHTGWVWPSQSHGWAACGAALQSSRAPWARLPLAEGQHAPGTFREVPEDRDGAAHWEHSPLGLRQLCLWSVQQIRNC